MTEMAPIESVDDNCARKGHSAIRQIAVAGDAANQYILPILFPFWFRNIKSRSIFCGRRYGVSMLCISVEQLKVAHWRPLLFHELQRAYSQLALVGCHKES